MESPQGQQQSFAGFLPALDTTPPMAPSAPAREQDAQALTNSAIPIFNQGFNQDDLSEIELSKRVAWAKEKKDRLEQAKADAQLPAIQKNIEDSRARAESILGELNQVRQQLNTPAPTLVQGQVGMGDLIAQGLAMIFGGRPDQVLSEGMAVADKRNQLAYQNELNKFQLTRENLGQLVDFLQRQALSEQGYQNQMGELGIRSEIEQRQNQQQQEYAAGEAEKQRAFQEREKAWTQLYSANSDGEVMAAAQRLQALDPTNAPTADAVQKAVASARSRREVAALDYYKTTVGRMIDAYAGVVPDSVKADLEQRVQAIARQFDVDPALFGEIPTEAYFNRQQAEQKLQQVRDEWKDRFKWMNEKERNDHAEALARIRQGKERLDIARQQANTSAARLEWDKLKGPVNTELKSWRTKLDSKSLELKNIDSQLNAIEQKLKAKDAKGKAKYIPFAEKTDLMSKKRALELKREGIVGQVQEIQDHLNELGAVEDTAGAASAKTYRTSSGATVRF